MKKIFKITLLIAIVSVTLLLSYIAYDKGYDIGKSVWKDFKFSKMEDRINE